MSWSCRRNPRSPRAIGEVCSPSRIVRGRGSTTLPKSVVARAKPRSARCPDAFCMPDALQTLRALLSTAMAGLVDWPRGGAAMEIDREARRISGREERIRSEHKLVHPRPEEGRSEANLALARLDVSQPLPPPKPLAQFKSSALAATSSFRGELYEERLRALFEPWHKSSLISLLCERAFPASIPHTKAFKKKQSGTLRRDLKREAEKGEWARRRGGEEGEGDEIKELTTMIKSISRAAHPPV
ncbi:uncharacterized protein VTP21DRAFT_6094 [Calcarisporiella thermophila]|uniref:uncharacterized protein n=1 Tax=Calcarisporiella thermophila TaxID=911321 RepID=UPI003742F601